MISRLRPVRIGETEQGRIDEVNQSVIVLDPTLSSKRNTQRTCPKNPAPMLLRGGALAANQWAIVGEVNA